MQYIQNHKLANFDSRIKWFNYEGQKITQY